MTVKYNIVERGNPSNREAPKKYYPSIQSSGRVTTQEMAEMAADRSTLTTADMMAAIETFLAIIPQQLKKGNIVELGDFGSFWLRSTSDGADTPEETNGTQITGVLPRFNPGKRFKAVLKTIEYTKGSVVREPEPEQQPA
jgi:predicted histone-like DNA-binding protein